MATVFIISEFRAWGGTFSLCVRKKQITKMVPLLVFWLISRKRNKKAFQGVESSWDFFFFGIIVWTLFTIGMRESPNFKHLVCWKCYKVFLCIILYGGGFYFNPFCRGGTCLILNEILPIIVKLYILARNNFS